MAMTTSPRASAAALAEASFSKLFFTPEGRTNPYPLYHELRTADPVHRSELGMWILTRYDDCWAVLRDPRFGKNYVRMVEQRFGTEWRKHAALTGAEHSMVNVSGPEHTRLRKLVSKGFTPRMIQRLEPTIEATVARLLEPFAESGGGDILQAVGFPLPVTIIGEMLGIPEADRAEFRSLVRDVVGILEMRPTAAQVAAANKAQLAIRAYFLALIAEKQRRPDDGLLSALVRVDDDGDRLSDDELVTMSVLLFAAGFETTTNLLGNGLLALLRAPDQIERLRADAALFANLPEEFLRYDGTVQMVNRVTESEVEVGGVTIPAGQVVFAAIGAGNHDPARYDHPDEFDVTRTDIQPLSFGGGVHFCLGAALARSEIRITVRALLDRFAEIELDGEPARFQDRLTLRGLPRLAIACRESRSRAAPPTARRTEAVSGADAPHAGPADTHRTGQAADRGLRPSSTDPAGDVRWRASLRTRIENDPTRADSLPVLTGERLAATAALLARNSLFQRCTTDEIEQLAATTYPVSFEPGDMLCIEGADSPEAYVIALGQAVVSIGGKGVRRIKEDDVVGEVGVLLGTARSATVTAVEHMITYAISRERLRDLVERNSDARAWMLEEMRRRYPDVASA